MGDEIARHGRYADWRQAGRRVASDHQLERIKGSGERRAKGTGDRGRSATTNHDALIGSTQMKSAAQ